MYEVKVLKPGYSRTNIDDSMSANGTCTLISGSNITAIVDTLGPWDKSLLLKLLKDEGLVPSDITHVLCTHGHPDHVGNNNLFTQAKYHLVGSSVFHKDSYFTTPLTEGKPHQVDGRDLYVLPTPGHTLDSVSVMVNTKEGRYCVAGDLFEKEEDIGNPQIWKDAGSEDETKQVKSRCQVVLMSDFIVPGHGPMFKVTNNMKIAVHETMGKIPGNAPMFGLFDYPQ